MATLRSNGDDEARAYAEIEVPPPRLDPTLDMDRVALTDPRCTPTLQGETRRQGGGPRDPDQAMLRVLEEPAVELPEQRPLDEAQPVIVPPELAAKWREEAKKKAAP